MAKCIICKKELGAKEGQFCQSCLTFVLYKYKSLKKFEKVYSIKLKETKLKPRLNIVGENGNIFSVLGKARRVAQQNNMDWDTIQAEALQGDYDHVLRTMMKYFEVE